MAEHGNPSLTALALAVVFSTIVSGARVTFWSDNNFSGDQYNIEMVYGECYRLGVSNDRMSSMSTNGHCVDLFTRDDCFGGMFRMESNSSACHRNFGECDMNDRVSSVRLCPRCRNSCYFYDGQQNYDDELVAAIRICVIAIAIVQRIRDVNSFK